MTDTQRLTGDERNNRAQRRRRMRQHGGGPEKWNELSTITKSLPEHDDRSNPEISRKTGIDLNNIPRSRIKLWWMGIAATDNFNTIYLTNKGRKLKGEYIKDISPAEFKQANAAWTAAKKSYNRRIQPGLINEE